MAQEQVSHLDDLVNRYTQEAQAIPQGEKRIIDHIQNGQKVLVIDCGTGKQLQQSILEARPNALIYTTNLSKEILEATEQTYSDPGLLCQRENTASFSFPDNFFDVVVFRSAILPQERTQMNQMYRLLIMIKSGLE